MSARKPGVGLRGNDMTSSEVEGLVVKLGKEGVTASKIGLILRDQHAVPSVKDATGKSVKAILKAHDVKMDLPEDLVAVILNAVKIHNHLSRNPKDFGTKRSLERVEARINKLAAYYKREGVLATEWRYNRERAALLTRSTA